MACGVGTSRIRRRRGVDFADTKDSIRGVACIRLSLLDCSCELVSAVSLQRPVDVHLFGDGIGNDNASRQTRRNRIHIPSINLNGVENGAQVSPYNFLCPVRLRYNRSMVSTSNLVTATSAADECVASSDDLKASNDELDVPHRTLGLSERLGSGDGEREALMTRQVAFEAVPASAFFAIVGPCNAVMVNLPECRMRWAAKQARRSAHQSLSQPLCVPKENLVVLKPLSSLLLPATAQQNQRHQHRIQF